MASSFFGGIGKALMDREMSKLANKSLTGAVMEGASPGTYSRYHRGGAPMAPQAPGMGPSDPGYYSDSQSDMDPSMGSNVMDQGTQNYGDGMIPAAHGTIVSRPTKVLIGESGPEAVVPLNNNPDNKVNAASLESVGGYRRGRLLR